MTSQRGFEGNLCLLTTRPHGFANLAIGAGFQTVTVRPFDPDDVATFTHTWYRLAYGSDSVAAEAQELIAAIKANERVAALASNPLLCTIIAVVYRNNRVLPERRVELYLKCCEALLDTWERNKDFKDSGLILGFGWQTKLELLAWLAYWMHGETERLAAGEELVVDQIAQALVAYELASSGSATDEARHFVETIRDRAGLLRGRGDGTLEFSHRTFQEYLAARHLATLDDEAMLDAVMPQLHAAWWEEVHLLLFGHLGSGKENSGRVERLVLCVLDAPRQPLPFLMPPEHPLLSAVAPGRWLPGWQRNARIGRMLGRDLTLAIRGYCQCAVTARSSPLTERLASEIASTLRRWRKRPRVMSAAFRKLVATINNDGLRTRLRAGFCSAALEALRDSNYSVRSAAADALGAAAGSDPSVVPALLKALLDSNDFVRYAAAEALGAAAGSDPATMSRILHELWAIANRSIGSFETLSHALEEMIEGHQLPGYRWISLQARRRRRALLRKVAVGTASALVIALTIWFGAGWISGLPADSPWKLFLASVPSVATLIGLLWMLVLVVVGEKRTPWG